MRARPVRQVRESSVLTGKSGPFVRTFPVQARPRGPSLAHRPNDTEQERTGNIAGRGGSFGDVPVFPDQRRFNQGQGSRPLPARLRQRMESAFGSDFSDVRVHQGPSADSLGALAFTQGRDIHFAPGRYNPASAEGQRVIAHELTHVVQQRQGRVAVPSGGGIPLNADASLESEADALGARAVQGESVAMPRTSSGFRATAGLPATPPIQGKSWFSGWFGGGGGNPPPSRREDREELPGVGATPSTATPSSTAPPLTGSRSGEPASNPSLLDRLRSAFSGTHDYSVSNPVYDLQENEDAEEAVERTYASLRRHAAPGGHGTEVSEEGTPIRVPILGSVTSTASPGNRSVTNVTGDDHLLRSGRVERTPVLDEGSRRIIIRSRGTGSGLFPGLNDTLADPVWRSVDREIGYDMNPGRREQEYKETEERYEKDKPF
jgi:hypothetical protein